MESPFKSDIKWDILKNRGNYYILPSSNIVQGWISGFEDDIVDPSILLKLYLMTII